MASRLSARLSRIETASQGSVGVDALRLLVSLLARLDALFWPWRTHTGSYRAEVRRLQKEYLAGIGGLRAAAQGESNWKTGHHTRNALIGAGLVSPLIEGGQVTGLRLTAQGIVDAIAMVGDRLCTVHESLPLLVTIRQLRGSGHAGEWVLENQVFPDACNGTDSTEWNYATEFCLPLLRCGLIEANSDLWNRVYYRAVDGVEGARTMQVAAGPLELPSELTSQRAEEPWADGLYLKVFDAERAALQRLDCADGGILIPVRCT